MCNCRGENKVNIETAYFTVYFELLEYRAINNNYIVGF